MTKINSPSPKYTGRDPKVNEESIPTNKKIFAGLSPLILGAGLLIAFDQWTKSLVIENIPFLGTWLPNQLAHFSSYIRIVHWRNSGAAFGMFSNGNTIFLILAVIASIFIVTFYPLIERDEWSLRVAMTLQLGGAIGNMIDRIRFGFVIDFISIKDFPVFNVADACISLGVAILLLGVIAQEIHTQKSKKLQLELTMVDSNRKEETE